MISDWRLLNAHRQANRETEWDEVISISLGTWSSFFVAHSRLSLAQSHLAREIHRKRPQPVPPFVMLSCDGRQRGLTMIRCCSEQR